MAQRYEEREKAAGEEITLGELHHASDFMGMNVKDQNDEDLGEISDFVFDRLGRISFAILSYGGVLGMGEKKTPVPFTMLQFDRDRKIVRINISKEKFEWTHDYRKETLQSPGTAADIYRFYGVTPYWQESAYAVKEERRPEQAIPAENIPEV